MKVSVLDPILDLNGNQVESLTLRAVIVAACINHLRTDDGLRGDTKAKLFSIAMKVHQEDEPDLKLEELTLVKERIGMAFAPLIVGRAWQLLEGEE